MKSHFCFPILAVILGLGLGGLGSIHAQSVAEKVVAADTLNRKLLMGYQGWYTCPHDGSAVNRWGHWFRDGSPVTANVTVDFWPDVSEWDPGELFPTQMLLANGKPALAFSAFSEKTVLRHFRWMQEYQLDGVFLQRFVSELSDRRFFALRNQVAANVRAGAEKYGRVFAIMYDISGQPTNTLVATLTNDWNYLVQTLGITASSRYLHHQRNPVVAVWGFGFAGRSDTPEQALTAIRFFKNSGCTVVGGVPAYWRTLSRDSQTNSEWAAVFRSFDVISPWSVGRYADDAGADRYAREVAVPDLASATAAGRDYLPVIFPGFSWHNLHGGPLNQIPRRGGTFYWRQARNVVAAGCTMIYGAMFDELDEGTAMFKLAPTAAQLPAQGSFVAIDADGGKLPADWYLRLANQTGKMLRGELPVQDRLPINP